MRHFVLSLQADDPAPTGLGDAASWFRFYKLNAGDEVYVPRLPGLQEITVGDVLWFNVDHRLIGYAPILRIEEDNFNNREELWFDARALVRCATEPACHITTSLVADDIVAEWLALG